MDFKLVEDLAEILKHRTWHLREQQQAPLHPSVVEALTYDRPGDWHLVVVQWPHIADDKSRLAYTQSDRKGDANIQTVTSIGKYLKQHWPHTPDHVIRDWVAAYCEDKFEIWTEQEQIIRSVELGPTSCMQSQGRSSHPFKAFDRLVEGTATQTDLDRHPYSVYDAKYGWAVAVRLKDGEIYGRALINNKGFVRSYAKAKDDTSRSETDHELESWLTQQGYKDQLYWPEGTKFRFIEHPYADGPLMPYLDGDSDRVSLGGNYVIIDEDGLYTCDNQDGTATSEDEVPAIGECEECGDTVREGDDYYYTGRHEESMCCSSCIDRFTLARGHSTRNVGYREYYVRDDDAGFVRLPGYRSYSIDTENPPGSVIELENGAWAELDDTVCIEDEYYLVEDTVCIEDEYYLVEDYRVVSLDKPNGDDEYALVDDTWRDGDGLRYHDNEPHWEDHNGDKWLMEVESEEVDGELWLATEIAELRDLGQVAPLFDSMAIPA